MKYQALVSLDLEANVTSQQRKLFYDSLEQQNFKKVPDITTTWTYTPPQFNQNPNPQTIKENTSDVLLAFANKGLMTAAQQSSIQLSQYKASIFAGLGKIKTF